MKYPISNSAIITSKQHPEKFVAVYRKESPEKVCLPGGKLDLGEDVLTAVAREVFEETGLTIPLNQFTPIYVGVCEGPKEHWTTAFWAEVDENIPLDSPEPQMRPFWTTKDHLMENTSFPKYNTEVFKMFEKLK